MNEPPSSRDTPAPETEAERQRRAIAARHAAEGSAREAFEALQRLARQFPDQVTVLLDLMSVAHSGAEYAVARSTATRLIELMPDSLPVVDRAAEILAATGHAEAASEAWMRLTGTTHAATAWTALAGGAFRRNRQDDAELMIRRALDLSCDNPMTLLVAARIARKAGRTDEASTLLASCSGTSTEPLVRFRALYETGELSDQMGEPAAAVAAWRNAKQCVEAEFAAGVAASRAARERRLARNRQLALAIPASPCRRWRALPKAPGLPGFAVLAGHPRSGTTLLEQVLAAHPKVADLDETAALKGAFTASLPRSGSDFPTLGAIGAASPLQLATLRSDYLRRAAMLCGRLRPDALLLEKNPNLTDALPLLLPVLPGVRLLVARRDPRDILLSCFRLPVTPEVGNVGWLRETDAVEDYRSMMEVWESLRDNLASDDGWMEVGYEALCGDFAAQARRATAFLGLDWHDDQERYRDLRAHAPVASPTYAEVRAPVHRGGIGRWRRYADLLPRLFDSFENEPVP